MMKKLCIDFEQHPVSHRKESSAKRRHKLHGTSFLSSDYKEEAPSKTTVAFEPGWAETIQTSGVLYYALVPRRRRTHSLRRIPSKRTQALQLGTQEENQDQKDQFLLKTTPIIKRRQRQVNFKRIAKELPINTSENKDTEQKEKQEKPVKDIRYRIIRIKVREDPDATESSSDDDGGAGDKRRPERRIHIQEIRIPIEHSRAESPKMEDKVERMRRDGLISFLTQNPCPKKKRSKRKRSSKSCREQGGIVSSLSSCFSLMDFDIPGPIPDLDDLVLSMGKFMQNFFEDCPEYPC